MSKLILVRHGESVWNKENLFTGWTDVSLSENGIEEAKKAGSLLKGEKIDVCYTSVLTRTLETAKNILESAELTNVPQIHDWHLNERHYGALQGLNKAETAEKYGADQVKIWRRSYDVKPPLLEKDDERNPAFDEKYKDLKPEELPLAESLLDTVNRVVPYYEKEILPRLQKGENVLVVAHGNSLRALEMYISKYTPEEIVELNIPTASPFVYEFDDAMNVTNSYYLK